MTDEEKQILISFYKQNPIFGDNADPKYRNIVKDKVKLVTSFDGKFSGEFLEKCLHSLRISLIQEIEYLPMEMSLNGSFVESPSERR